MKKKKRKTNKGHKKIFVLNPKNKFNTPYLHISCNYLKYPDLVILNNMFILK